MDVSVDDDDDADSAAGVNADDDRVCRSAYL